MFRKLHWKLTALFFTLFLVSFLVAGFYATPTIDNYLTQETRKHITTNARVAADAFAPLLASGDLIKIDRYAKVLSKAINSRITVIDKQGIVIGESDLNPAAMENHASRSEMQGALEGKPSSTIRFSHTKNVRMLYAAQPVIDRHKVVAVVRVALPLTDLQSSLNRVRWIMAVTIGLALILSTSLAFFMAKRFVLPIRNLTKVAERIADGDFEQRVNITSSVELEYLGKTVNYMAKRLKNTIREISNEKNKIKAIVTSLSDGILALDGNGRILLMNQRAQMMFGQKEEQVLGKYVLELTRNQGVENTYKEVIEDGSEVIKEIQLFPGAKTLVELHAVPIASDRGKVTGVVMDFRDVTELRSLEQMRTEFVANVSHELRTPLTSIKGFVETLLDGADSEPEVRRRFLSIISQETQRLHRLIDDLLSLSRLENILTIDDVSVEFKQVLIKTLEVLRPQAEAKQIALAVKVADDIPKVGINQDMLGQVLINLLENAIKYTGPSGFVTLEAFVADEQLQVRITDTGMGIPPEALPRIFERFYRVDRARSRQVGGTGLGLSIVKHILERHGQRIWVESVYGKGSTFTFTLPPGR